MATAKLGVPTSNAWVPIPPHAWDSINKDVEELKDQLSNLKDIKLYVPIMSSIVILRP